MEVQSECALRVAHLVWRPGHGGFAFTVVCKATFDLRPDLSPLAVEQEPVALADVFAGKAGGLAVASDLVPLKKRPEVLLTGHAYAPMGKPTPSLVARLVVDGIDKTIGVFGDRYFARDGRSGEPAPFTRMPLLWERAAGGLGTVNPIGIPLGPGARPDALGHFPVPNLLPAGVQIDSRNDAALPVGFGPIAPSWPSRAALLHRHAVGWDPSRWQERPLPDEIDLRYFNAAPPDQQRAQPFGEEAIYLENLHPSFARISTRLARVAPTAMADRGSGPQPLQLRCDTLIIDTDRARVMLVWRAHVVVDKPDHPGRVVVTGPAAPEPSIPAWLPKIPDVFDVESTIIPIPNAASTPNAVLPFSSTSTTLPAAPPIVDVAPKPPKPTGNTLLLDDDEPGATTVAPFFRQSPVLPFITPENKSGAAPPFASDAPARLSDILDVPAEVAKTPSPPPLLGPIAVAPEGPAKTEESAPPAAVFGREAEVEVDFDAHPPPRCGALAARLACAAGDEDKAGEVLRAEALDAERWERIHAFWLDRIRDEAARSRKALLSEYDRAYVAALSAERGEVTLEVYARLAEAAERGKIAEALAERGLPEGAWPHIHREWIGRMVKNARMGKQVRAEIDAIRAAH